MAVEVSYLIPGSNEESGWAKGSLQSGFYLKLGPLTLGTISCAPEVDTATPNPCVTISPVGSNDRITTHWEGTRSKTTGRSPQRKIAIVVNLREFQTVVCNTPYTLYEWCSHPYCTFKSAIERHEERGRYTTIIITTKIPVSCRCSKWI